MHSLDQRRVHVDLVLRAGQWSVDDPLGRQLDPEDGPLIPVLVELKPVGAKRGVDEAEQRTKNPVLVQ